MKQCPACNRTYTDDAQLFCLEDGSQLITASFGGSGSPSPFDPNATLAYTPTRDTNPPPESFYPQAPHVPTPPAPTPRPAWSPTPYTPQAQPAHKPNARPWIIGAIVGVIVLGIGIVVLLSIIGRESADNTNKNSNRVVASNNRSSNSVTTTNTNKSTVATPSTVLKDDFSSQNWPVGDQAYGSFYQDGEYHMKGRPKLYIFMFPLNNSANDLLKYATKDATVKVTARNVDGKSPEYGYGLIVQGKLNEKGNLEGYGFLIYTGAESKYEIVHFIDGAPTNVVNWTPSPLIRKGTNSNQIEVRTKGSQLSMYVNGQFLKSITDTSNYTDGYVGLYTSETSEVAFDDMEIDRETGND
jgi:hypothetical protein